MEDRGRRALLGREVDVARRQGEPVGLPDGRTGDDLGRDREVERHAPDDHDLLGVLLAEVRVLGADQVEQDRDDGRDPIEMSRPGGSFQRPRHRPDRDDRVEAGRVDLGRVRGEDDVHALRLADREIARLGARIARVVLGDVELARVDEDRDDRRRVGGARLAHERAVTVVEPAHRRDEADRTRRRRRGRREARCGFGRPRSSGRRDQRSRSSGMPPTGIEPVAWSDAPRPSTSSSTASSIRTVCSGPGNVPAPTSAR